MNTVFFTSPQDAAGTINIASLLLRLGLGIPIFPHGYSKANHFAQQQDSFMNFLGLGSTVSLLLVIFSELVCSVLLLLGLMTRAVLVPLIITGLVLVFMAHQGDVFGEAATSTLFLLGFLALLVLGSSRYSLDNWLFNN